MKKTHLLISVILILMLGLLTSISKDNPTLETPVPYETIIEPPVEVEPWMSEPFESCEVFEEEIKIEGWMTKPFNINEKL